MSQLYIQENLVRIQSLIHKISCRPDSVTSMPTPRGSTPKSICPPSPKVGGHKCLNILEKYSIRTFYFQIKWRLFPLHLKICSLKGMFKSSGQTSKGNNSDMKYLPPLQLCRLLSPFGRNSFLLTFTTLWACIQQMTK